MIFHAETEIRSFSEYKIAELFPFCDGKILICKPYHRIAFSTVKSDTQLWYVYFKSSAAGNIDDIFGSICLSTESSNVELVDYIFSHDKRECEAFGRKYKRNLKLSEPLFLRIISFAIRFFRWASRKPK
jgi:hypothetical protein